MEQDSTPGIDPKPTKIHAGIVFSYLNWELRNQEEVIWPWGTNVANVRTKIANLNITPFNPNLE